MSLINTPCLHLSQPSRRKYIQQGHRPWKCLFWTVCFLEKTAFQLYQPGNHRLCLSDKTNAIYIQLIFQDSAPIQLAWAMLVGVHYIYDLPFSSNETWVHSWTIVYLLLECGAAVFEKAQHAVTTNRQDFITQKRFVKKRSWNFRNLEKK
jgi:hypothetical protein